MIEKTIKIKKDTFVTSILVLIAIGLLSYNQFMIFHISSNLGIKGAAIKGVKFSSEGEKDISDVDLSEIKGTGFAIAALFPVENIETPQDAIDMIVPTGTPGYGEAMGVTFDDPEGSLSTLANAQRTLLAGLTPEEKERFINLASKPVGISCEYCCGLQAVGIRDDGSSSCGCKHNPALLSVTMWLIQNTDYTDAEILREALKWKALFFPKDMVEIALTVAGGDTSGLEELPGMVGGC